MAGNGPSIKKEKKNRISEIEAWVDSVAHCEDRLPAVFGKGPKMCSLEMYYLDGGWKAITIVSNKP